jgi:uncharacterized MnhB-related membrane protein
MITSERPAQPQPPAISAEAMIGIGITIAALGLLGLLLGWAQQMRSVPDVAFVWFVIGGVLTTVGIVVTVLAKARKRGR